MKSSKLLMPITIIALLLAMVPQATADISNAAVLYLRIAPGARAAGMGEAYVAIADDATATHWNPAGLGAYPLSPGWVQQSIPENLQPITDIAALKSRRATSYAGYDVWAITSKGLARYDNKKWYTFEEFDTKTDQTVRKIVASYFSLTDEEWITRVASKVARFNAGMDYESLDSLRAEVMAQVPDSYGARTRMAGIFDTLLSGYDLCLIDWDRVKDISNRYEDGMKDGTLTEGEIDKIFVAVEKSRTRFIPEQLNIEYSALFDAGLTGLVSAGNYLAVGTENGLYIYNGRRWQIISTHNGLPSPNVTALATYDDFIYVATDLGIIKYDGESLPMIGAEGELPNGPVAAVAPAANGIVWAVVNNKLYRFDGQFWTDSRSYTVVLDDTPERIAGKLAIYGTTAEKDAIAAEIARLNAPDADSPSSLDLQPGQQIRVPYTVGIRGKVTALFAEVSGRLWVGTTYGILHLDDVWHLPGYRIHEVQSYQTLAELLELPPSTPALDATAYQEAVMEINELMTDEVQAGQTILLYRNPAAAPVHGIAARRDKIYFATSQGLIEYDGVSWDKAEIMGMDKTNVAQIQAVDNEIWFASDRKLVAKANSTTDISMMYVKWLPELADDLYYAFASFASHKEGWGTFGGNFTYISYGTITRTGEQGQDLGTFESFDLALTGSYGTSITEKIKGGVSAKLLYSKLADQGAGTEQGEGTSTGFAVDFGFMYHLTRRLNLGLAITNLGPDMAYIDAAQSDPLPRNLAFGFAYKALQTDYYHFLITSEVNKSLVGVDDGFREELKQLVLNGGAEFSYASLLAVRAGYIYDQEGDIKTATLGVGIGPVGIFKFDFSYIPSTKDGVLDNTLRISFAVQP